jgi:hypothetical protein
MMNTRSSEMTTVENLNGEGQSVLHSLFEKLPECPVDGHYDSETQTWSLRVPEQFTPVKNNRES